MLYVLGLKDRLKDQKITSCATCFPVTLALSCLTRYGRLFSLAFDERRTSRPYKRAQHLAGIGFSLETAPLLSDLEPASSETAINEIVLSGLSLYRQQNRLQTVVQRIRSRKRAQQALV